MGSSPYVTLPPAHGLRRDVLVTRDQASFNEMADHLSLEGDIKSLIRP